MVKVSHNNVNVVIRISVLKVTSTVVFVGLGTFTMGEECTVSLSLFADPEEEPCKSTVTTSEPCSPVFKEAQPRPSYQSTQKYNISYTNILNLYLHVFLLLVIYCCNKASNRIVPKQKDLVFFSWISLSPEVSRLSPYTHAQQHTQTSRNFYIFAMHWRIYPFSLS